MLRYAFLIFIGLLLTSACHRKNSQRMNHDNGSVDLDNQVGNTNPDPLPRFVTWIGFKDTLTERLDTLLFMNRTACFGFCPTFDFTLFSNGVVLYNGIQHTVPLGKKWLLLKESDWDEIMKLARMADFFELENVYPVNQREMLVDLPNINILIKNDNKRKHILDNHSAPAKLKTLEEAVENKLKALLSDVK
ncbi:MAG: hypothetical protein IPH93_06000 [Saprospiraceae bacterium]|nr:hypothetical protein [Saprospiraceae bacterium]